MDRVAFIAAFRPLERRFDACLAEIHKLGAENINRLGQDVMDEIKAVHSRFMEMTLDDIDMKKEVYDKLSDNDTETFAGQWNRVVDFVYIYEDMFGRDPDTLREIEEWEEKQAENNGDYADQDDIDFDEDMIYDTINNAV